jgi:hypothetical protein
MFFDSPPTNAQLAIAAKAACQAVYVYIQGRRVETAGGWQEYAIACANELIRRGIDTQCAINASRALRRCAFSPSTFDLSDAWTVMQEAENIIALRTWEDSLR